MHRASFSLVRSVSKTGSRCLSSAVRVARPLANKTLTSVLSSTITSASHGRTGAFMVPLCQQQSRLFSNGGELVIKVPSMGDSVSEGTVLKWLKKVGDGVERDEVITAIETDKVSVDIRAPEAGAITEISAGDGTVVKVGQTLAKLALGATGAKPAAAPKAAEGPKKESKPAPATPATPAPSAAPAAQAPKAAPAAAPAAKPAPAPAPVFTGERTERRVAMSRMRQTISKRLKNAQNTNAMLTTFQEVDMSALMALRNDMKDEFQKKHGVKLGFMSAFVKASVAALKDQPVVNAVIDGNDIVYRDYIDISVAVATPTGLVVPVVRNCESLSFAGVEKTIAELGEKARVGGIAMEDMAGGTFTISNGGVYGSMLGTPIINPPQSAILGMHGITKRAIVNKQDQIVVAPVMYLALTYDHRLIDGREAVTFLRKVKDCIEDPRKLLLDV